MGKNKHYALSLVSSRPLQTHKKVSQTRVVASGPQKALCRVCAYGVPFKRRVSSLVMCTKTSPLSFSLSSLFFSLFFFFENLRP